MLFEIIEPGYRIVVLELTARTQDLGGDVSGLVGLFRISLTTDRLWGKKNLLAHSDSSWIHSVGSRSGKAGRKCRMAPL